MREDAVIRKLEILGEAVKHLFDDRQRGGPAHNQVQGFQAITYESGGLEDDRSQENRLRSAPTGSP